MTSPVISAGDLVRIADAADGSSQGAKEALREAAARIQELETTRDAARTNFLTMQGAAAQLLKRAQTLEAALRLMLDAYEGVYNCVGSDGHRYRDSDAKTAEDAARSALGEQPEVKP